MYYYETHITIEFPGEDQIGLVKALAEPIGFHMGDLLLMKNEEERSHRDLFFTSRQQYNRLDNHDRNMALARSTVAAQMLCRQLDFVGYKVLRYKIEDTIIDSRIDDAWNMIEHG